MAVIFLSIKNDLTKVLETGIDIFAKEAKVDDKGKRAAETLTVFQGNIGTGIHHEILRKLGLSEFFTLTGHGETVGHVIAEGAFAGVFHGVKPHFR